MASTSTFNSVQLYLKTRCTCWLQNAAGLTPNASCGTVALANLKLIFTNVVFSSLSLAREESGCNLGSRTYFKSLRFSNLFLKFYTYFYPKLKNLFLQEGEDMQVYTRATIEISFLHQPLCPSPVWCLTTSLAASTSTHSPTSFLYSQQECKVFHFNLPVNSSFKTCPSLRFTCSVKYSNQNQ